MVDSVGRLATGASLGVLRSTADTSTTPIQALAATAATSSTTTTGTSTLASAMAASAPVDADRVAEIKQAIKDGRFPITPARIADRLIALKLDWKSNNEPA